MKTRVLGPQRICDYQKDIHFLRKLGSGVFQTHGIENLEFIS
jgi:hypothetical protein